MENHSCSIPTGIASVPQVAWGTHFCHFYKDKEELSNVIVPFIKAGLDNNEKCILIISDIIESNEAQNELNNLGTNIESYVDSGQLLIVDHKAWYTRQQKFDINDILKHWIEAENLALEGGYTGLRAVGMMSLLFREYRDYVVHYETIIDSAIRKIKMVAICSYSLDKLSADEIIDLVTNHAMVIIHHNGSLKVIGNSRLAKMSILKNKGLSYADIGNQIGVTKQRIHQVFSNRKKTDKVSNQMLTISEAASLLNVHINTVRRWGNLGILPTYRIGSRGDRRFKREDVNKLVIS